MKVLVERDAVVRQPQQPGEPALAVLDRLAPDVLAVHLEQVERTEDRAGVGPVAADEVEHGQAVVVADDGLAVDDARADGQRLDRLGDEREAVREVVPVAREKPDAAPAPVRQDPEAVVLDLVNPARARRRLAGRSRQAGFEAGNGLFGAQSAPELTCSGHRGKDKGRRGGVEVSGFKEAQAGNCSIFSGWRDQIEARFCPVSCTPRAVDCS